MENTKHFVRFPRRNFTGVHYPRFLLVSIIHREMYLDWPYLWWWQTPAGKTTFPECLFIFRETTELCKWDLTCQWAFGTEPFIWVCLSSGMAKVRLLSASCLLTDFRSTMPYYVNTVTSPGVWQLLLKRLKICFGTVLSEAGAKTPSHAFCFVFWLHRDRRGRKA